MNYCLSMSRPPSIPTIHSSPPISPHSFLLSSSFLLFLPLRSINSRRAHRVSPFFQSPTFENPSPVSIPSTLFSFSISSRNSTSPIRFSPILPFPPFRLFILNTRSDYSSIVFRVIHRRRYLLNIVLYDIDDREIFYFSYNNRFVMFNR